MSPSYGMPTLPLLSSEVGTGECSGERESAWASITAQTFACGKPSAKPGTSTTQHPFRALAQKFGVPVWTAYRALFGWFLRIANVRAAEQSPANHPCARRLSRRPNNFQLLKGQCCVP